MSGPFVGAYWGERQESAESCANRLAILLEKIGSRHPLLREWRKKGRRKAEALGVSLDVSTEGILGLLRTNNDEVDGSAISDLGFNLSLWNGSEECGVSLNATCGAFSKYVKNSVVLQLPPGVNEQVLQGVDFELLVQDFVDAFDPEAAMLTSIDFINQNGGGAPWDVGGWVTYELRTGRVVSR